METLFDEILPDDQEMPASGIRSWLGSIQTAGQTGAVRLYWPPNEKMLLHIYRGAWLASRPNAPAGKELDGLDQAEAYEGGVFGRFIPLTAHGLIHSRLLSLAGFHQGKGIAGAAAGMGRRESPREGGEPYLVKMTAKDRRASILFNAVSNQPHSLYVSGRQILDQTGIPEAVLKMRDDPLCVVDTFPPDYELDAWREVCLRMAFKRLTDDILERLELLTGRVITYSFSRILAVFTASQNLEVSITQRQWNNSEVFRTSQEAATIYRKIFGELLDHFSAVIGPRLMESNLREVYDRRSGETRELLKFHEILPEAYRS